MLTYISINKTETGFCLSVYNFKTPKRNLRTPNNVLQLRVLERGVWVVAINKEDPTFLCCPFPELPPIFANLMEEREDDDDDNNKVISSLTEEEGEEDEDDAILLPTPSQPDSALSELFPTPAQAVRALNVSLLTTYKVELVEEMGKQTDAGSPNPAVWEEICVIADLNWVQASRGASQSCIGWQ